MPQDKFTPLMIGELPTCEVCGQKPDSISFDVQECRPGCPLKLELREKEVSPQAL